jgi:sarcosine oxidase gamma subunit
MRSGVALRSASDEPALLTGTAVGKLRLLELSGLARLGVKGPRAQAFLHSVGVDTPAAPNHVVLGASGLLVAALSKSEFFLSDVPGASSSKIADVREAVAGTPEGSFLVEHGEALYCFGLAGALRYDLYARLCSLDFGNPAAASGRVLQTKLAHLSAIVLRCGGAADSYDLIFGDVSLATYMWRMLCETVNQLGGDAVGIRPQ